MEEINKMTEIVDAVKTIKTVEMGTQWKNILINKWKLNSKFNDFHPDVLKTII